MKFIVMGSSRGTSLDSILKTNLKQHISLIVSDKINAPILEKAKRHNIKTYIQPHTGETRTDYDKKMIEVLDQEKPDVILMIGYMRIVSDIFITTFKGRILNIHPSLLPKHSGLIDLEVHKSVLDSNDTQSGCTVHQVTEIVDGGEIVLQKLCKVSKTDTVESLKQKVQALEGQALVEVLKNWKDK